MDDEINYNELVETALMEVVKTALNHAGDFGLPGDQHFYITFKTHYPGVQIPAHLKERYKDDMTIVLQHQFSSLVIGDDSFSVDLSFNQRLETLTIPYAALTAFADPSVQFGLQFSVDGEDEGDGDGERFAGGVETDNDLESATGDAETGDLPADEGTQKQGEVIALDAFRKK